MRKIIIYTILITITLIVHLGCERKIEFENLEPPLTKDELLKKSPDFLTEEQQNLYLRTQKFYVAANASVTTAIDSMFEGETKEPYRTFNLDSEVYIISRGRYKKWDDFVSVIDGLFTTNGWRTSIRQIFIECDGNLCFKDGEKGSGMTYNQNFQDDFELLEQTESIIRFKVIGHYSQLYPLINESNEEQEKRLKDNFEYTQEFIIVLVLTENGWRFDEFHDTFIDQGEYIGSLK